MDRLLEIEIAFGRKREARWAARTIDLDLLLYNELIVHEPDLVVPHPRMSYRRFVLEGACEIAGEMWHPLLHMTLNELLHQLDSGANLVAILGTLPAGRQFAQQIASSFDSPLPFPLVPVKGKSDLSRQRPKLTIELSDSSKLAPPPLGPTLRLADIDESRHLAEAVAAIQAVWPELCRPKSNG
jgi:hypothetical protein